MHKTEHPETCTGGCQPLVAERNRFFTGKYMTARDFAAEQDYFLSRHRLHNRVLHGWGVVCGFGVTKHPGPDCDDWIVVGPGIALDCCGRELILRKRTAFRVAVPGSEPTPEPNGCDDRDEGAKERTDQTADPDQVDTDQKGDRRKHREYEGSTNDTDLPEPDRPLYVLCATYQEEDIEYVPVIFDDCDCDPQRREANRVSETAKLELHPFADLHPACWGRSGGDEYRCRDDCDDDLPAGGGGCIDPECECGGCVPLALITVREDGTLIIDTRGRRQLPPPPHYMTHIVETSWKHGSVVPINELADDRRLEIRFDREISPAEGFATGINPETLIVQHGGEGESTEFVPYDLDEPPQLVDGCRAVYTISPGFLNGRRRGSLVNSTIYVTLLSDFVLDCHGLPVDGDHLRGLLPTGDSVAGGTFRSWFRVGDERNNQEGAT